MTVIGDMMDNAISVTLYPEDIDILESALKDYYFKVVFDSVASDRVLDILLGIKRL